MKYIVTGGCGFIGSTLIKELLKNKNNKVLNIDSIKQVSVPESLFEFKKNNNYILKKIDLKSLNLNNNIIHKFKPDCIFHLAAETHVDRSIQSPKNFITNNIIGTFNLLEMVREYVNKSNYNKKLKFVNISTDEVYGSLKIKEKSFKETNKFFPNSPYSASKASAEMLCRSWYKTFNIPIIITNCSNNFGPWQYPEKLIPVVISQLLKNKKIPIYGNGKNIRDWIYVNDHANYLINISKKGKIGETYNIGGGKEISNLELVKKICKIFDKIYPEKKPHKKLISYVIDRKGHDFRYSINSKKIEKLLKIKSNKSFEKDLNKTVNWYIKNQKWLFNKIKK